MAARNEFDAVPAQFRRAVDEVLQVESRSEILIEQMPPPQRIAPHAFALSGDVLLGGLELATGRFILLHDPAGNSAWEGTFRCVTFAKADIEPELAADPVITEVGWSWLIDALAARGAGFSAASGSVTVVRSDAFGQLADDGGSAQIEVRASWTPDDEFGAQALGWFDLLAAVAGLPPVEPDVVPLTRRRSSR